MVVATRGTGGMPNRVGLPGIDLVTGVRMCAVNDLEGKDFLREIPVGSAAVTTPAGVPIWRQCSLVMCVGHRVLEGRACDLGSVAGTAGGVFGELTSGMTSL